MSCWGRRQKNRVSAGTAVAAWLGAAARERGWLEERLGQELQLTKIHSLLVRQGVSVPYRTLHRFCVQELGFGLSVPDTPSVVVDLVVDPWRRLR